MKKKVPKNRVLKKIVQMKTLNRKATKRIAINNKTTKQRAINLMKEKTLKKKIIQTQLPHDYHYKSYFDNLFIDKSIIIIVISPFSS